MERNAGTLLRLLTTPLSRAQVLLGKAVACFAAILAVEALLLVVGAVAFGRAPRVARAARRRPSRRRWPSSAS